MAASAFLFCPGDSDVRSFFNDIAPLRLRE
jgi:hypothetical protein